MAEKEIPENVAVRSITRIAKFFGILSPDDISRTSAPQVPTQHYGTWSNVELSNMPGISPKAQNRDANRQDFNSIMMSLTGTAQNTKAISDKLARLKTMAPEIDMAKLIIVGSIISPNDMQTDLVNVGTEDKTIDETTRTKVNDLLNTHFNEELHYGVKLSDWIGTAIIDEGAVGVVILSQEYLRTLNSIADRWEPSMESISSLIEADNTSMMEDLTRDVLSEIDLLPAMEAIETKDRPKIAKDLAKSSFTIIRDNKDKLNLTTDLRYLHKNGQANSAAIKKLTEAATQMISSIDPTENLEQSDGKPRNPVLSLIEMQNIGKEDMPTWVVYPTECIIPCCIPGSKSEHAGYWLLHGEDGQPLRVVSDATITSEMSVESMAQSAMKAAYGVRTGAMSLSNINSKTAFDTQAAAFTVAMRHLLESKLGKMGLKGLDLEIHSAVGKSIYFNLLHKMKIQLVFVPEPLMCYFRFDHREDGTGKSLLEGIEFILALRTMLTVAGIMAAIDNSTKHHIIEMDVDEQNQQSITYMETVRRNYMNKYVPTFTTDPYQASEAICDSHIHIKPRSMQGTTNSLEITTDTRTGQSPQPDTTLMDTLNNWAGLGLFVPPAALNQTSEAEYSRSIATNNLLFANRVRRWQGQLEPINNKFAQNYVFSHAGLRNQILCILKQQKKDDGKEITKASVNGDVDLRTSNSPEAQLSRIIGGIRVKLPPPNVSTSKAHYEEMRNYMDTVDSLVQKRYPDELLAGDQDGQPVLASLRAIFSAQLINQFMNEIGFHELADIPDTDDAVTKDVVKLQVFLSNLKRKLDGMKKLTTPEDGEEENSGGGSW